MQPQSKYERTKHLCLCLAKMLERAPSISCADESREGEWIDQVDQLSRALAAELGEGKSLSAAMAHFSELLAHDAECSEFVQKNCAAGNTGRITWLVLLDYARSAASMNEALRENIKGIRDDAAELVKARDAEILELNAHIRDLQEELTSRGPKKFRTIAA